MVFVRNPLTISFRPAGGGPSQLASDLVMLRKKPLEDSKSYWFGNSDLAQPKQLISQLDPTQPHQPTRPNQTHPNPSNQTHPTPPQRNHPTNRTPDLPPASSWGSVPLAKAPSRVETAEHRDWPLEPPPPRVTNDGWLSNGMVYQWLRNGYK